MANPYIAAMSGPAGAPSRGGRAIETFDAMFDGAAAAEIGRIAATAHHAASRTPAPVTAMWSAVEYAPFETPGDLAGTGMSNLRIQRAQAVEAARLRAAAAADAVEVAIRMGRAAAEPDKRAIRPAGAQVGARVAGAQVGTRVAGAPRSVSRVTGVRPVTTRSAVVRRGVTSAPAMGRHPGL